MGTLISTLEKMLDKTVYAAMQHGISERIALHLIVDVCKARIKRLEK